MLFPTLLALGMGLFGLPLWTYEVYTALRESTLCRIAGDNASIRLGQASRDALEVLRIAESGVSKLEHAHHPAHICARRGFPPCVAADSAAETGIRISISVAETRARLLWMGLSAMAIEAAAPTTKLPSIRAVAFPARRRFCRICSLAVGWTLPEPLEVATLQVKSMPQMRVAVLRPGGGKWNYQVAEQSR